MIQTILKISQRVPCFWWFHTITFKFGNGQLVISNAKIVLGCLMILMYYVLQRKQATLKRIFKRQALSMKAALVDLWQLAFSYQVNPLAAVQPVPAATRGTCCAVLVDSSQGYIAISLFNIVIFYFFELVWIIYFVQISLCPLWTEEHLTP
ncbi:hypothetical protein ACSBR1_008068 [Camellia fascicularis]